MENQRGGIIQFSVMIWGTRSSNRSTPVVITSSSDGGIKNGVIDDGSDSLKSSSAAQQRVAVDHGET